MYFAVRWNTPKDNISIRISEKAKQKVPWRSKHIEAIKKIESKIGRIDSILFKRRDLEAQLFKNAIEEKRLGKNLDLLACAANLHYLRLLCSELVNYRSALEQLRSRIESIDFLDWYISNVGCLLRSNLLPLLRLDHPLGHLSMTELSLELEKTRRKENSSDKVQFKQKSDLEKVLGIFAVVEEIRVVFEERACHVIANDNRVL